MENKALELLFTFILAIGIFLLLILVGVILSASN